MYDTFPSGEIYEAKEFDFYAGNLDIWVNGNKVINFFGLDIYITCRVKEIQGENKMIIVFPDNLKDHLANTWFDILVASDDTLVMLSLPSNNANDTVAALTKIYGNTRPSYTFEPKEPYACSLFLKNGILDKLSFNIYGTNKSVDLY